MSLIQRLVRLGRSTGVVRPLGVVDDVAGLGRPVPDDRPAPVIGNDYSSITDCCDVGSDTVYSC